MENVERRDITLGQKVSKNNFVIVERSETGPGWKKFQKNE